jgi:hypothetical protein
MICSMILAAALSAIALCLHPGDPAYTSFSALHFYTSHHATHPDLAQLLTLVLSCCVVRPVSDTPCTSYSQGLSAIISSMLLK